MQRSIHLSLTYLIWQTEYEGSNYYYHTYNLIVLYLISYYIHIYIYTHMIRTHNPQKKEDTTMLSNILFFVSIFLVIVLAQIKRRRNQRKYNLPPGPRNLPIIGNLHNLSELPHRSFYKFSQKYGPLVYFKVGSIPTIVASSVETAKEFLKTNNLNCCSRPLLTSSDKLTYGFHDVALTPYGEEWRVLRKICILELFNTKKVASFRSIREEEVENMMRNISFSQNTEINLGEELMLLANNITCRTALGNKYVNDGGGANIRKILKETQALFIAFFYADYIPMLGWLDVVNGTHARLQKNFLQLDEIYQQVIDAHINKEDCFTSDTSEDIVDTLLHIQRTSNELTTEQIKGILMNIFVAGSDTSSAAVEWAMTELIRNPKAMKKAQEEVRGMFMKKKGKIEESEIDKLTYMKCVVKETMRMHPPGPLLIQRETMQHFKINGYDILPKTRLMINVWAMGRDPNVWEKPNEFSPERFKNSPINFWGHDFELIPFGAGRRICPGMHMGIAVVEIALANLLYHFDWKLPEGMTIEDIDVGESPGLAVHRSSALKLMAVPVNHGED